MDDNNAMPIDLSSYVKPVAQILEKFVDSKCLGNNFSWDCYLEWRDSYSDLIIQEVTAIIQNHVVPKFWSHFTLSLEDFDPSFFMKRLAASTEFQYKLFWKFMVAVKDLETSYTALKDVARCFWLLNNYKTKTISEEQYLQTIMHEILLGQKPPYFSYIVHAFYDVSFKAFTSINLPRTITIHAASEIAQLNEGANCGGCNQKFETCECRHLIEISKKVNRGLQHMGLLDRMAGQNVTSLVQKYIKNHITDTCLGVFDRSHIKELEMWLDRVVISWLTQIFNNRNSEVLDYDFKTETIIRGFKVKLTYFLYENYAHSLIDQFFSITIDFPDSVPALDDLKICMEKIETRKYFIKTLKNTFEVRILHPGVNTMDILTGYIASIKAIRYLDDSGVILETVTEPIKNYLRKRNDTVRRVVTGLTEEGPTDLSEELARAETLKETGGYAIIDEFSNWDTWLPDPFGFEYCARMYMKNPSRTADIISMVVNIYGSKELFMNEYRNLLADRLLTQLDFSPEKEIRNLELLKLRFGENLLHSCEVMLKDITDSKRININIQSDAKYKESKLFDISSLIISAQFWPTFNKESLEIPEEIKKEFEKYTTAFEAYKGNRTLNWRNVTGRVIIVVELGDRVMEFIVPPTQAVIIYHFQKKDEWNLDDLSNLMKVPPTILRRRIAFWQTHGLIREIRDRTYKLIEQEGLKAHLNEMSPNEILKDEDDAESAMASASDQREEELQVFWSYIVGMLTNLDSLPIERIHQMLKLFATHGIGIEFSQEELKGFLQRKVREHKLWFSGGVYQLPK